jgi:hypothetical protein
VAPPLGGALLAAFLLLAQGCATTPTPPPALEPLGLGRVAIVASSAEPEVRFEGFARGKGEGALTGAGAGFAGCAAGLGHGACSGPFCGAVVMVWLAVCGVTSAAGGLAGAALAQDAATVRAAEAALATAISGATLQESLRQELAAVAATSGLGGAASPDTIVETSLVRVRTVGAGLDSPLTLVMQARVRVLRASDKTELRVVEMSHQGERRRLAEWSADNGARLLAGLKHGYETLGRELFDAVFRLYPFPDREFQGAGTLAVAFGLAPEQPKMRGTLTEDTALRRRIEWLSAGSLRPTLRWQAFPRPADLGKAPDAMARATRVSYDLVLVRESSLAPSGEVYRREGLPGPEHTVEIELAPGAYYFWSVRARFELDGREWVTEWAVNNWFAFGKTTTPSSSSYRFRAP